MNPDQQRVLIDRELHLPESRFADPDRLADAGIPEGALFATKPEQAWRMIERTCDDPLLVFGWVTDDEAYGDNTALRRRCTGRGMNCCSRSPATTHSYSAAPAPGPTLRSPTWTRQRGSGSRAGTEPRAAAGTTGRGSAWVNTRANTTWGLSRRSISDPTDLASYRCAANRPVDLPELVRVARLPLEHRGMLPSVQERGRPGPLPGPQAHRLVPARHPGHGRPRPPGLPGRRPAPRPRRPRLRRHQRWRG